MIKERNNYQDTTNKVRRHEQAEKDLAIKDMYNIDFILKKENSSDSEEDYVKEVGDMFYGDTETFLKLFRNNNGICLMVDGGKNLFMQSIF